MDLSGLFNKDPHINPFHEALKTGLENYTNAVKAAYATQQTQADIRYKNALSDMMGFNINKAIQSSPILSANPPPQIGGGGPPPNNNNPNPQPTQTAGGNSQPSILDSIAHFFTGKNNITTPAAPQTTSNAARDGYETVQAPDNWDGDIRKLPKPSGNNNPDRGYAFDDKGNNIVGDPNKTPEQINQAAGDNSYNPNWQYQSPSSIPPLDLSDPKYNIGPANAPKALRIARAKDAAWQTPEAASAIAAQKEAAIKQASAEQDANQKYLTASIKNVKAAQDFKVNYNDAFNSLKKAHINGPIAGMSAAKWLAKFDPNYMSAVSSANSAVISSIDQIAAKPSDMRTGLLIDAKLNPNAPLKTAEHWVKKNDIITNRAIEQNKFNAYAMKHGITGNELQNAWDDYNVEYPIVNKTGRIISVNLNKYEDYLDHKYGGKRVQSSDQNEKNAASSEGKKTVHWNWNGSSYDKVEE